MSKKLPIFSSLYFIKKNLVCFLILFSTVTSFSQKKNVKSLQKEISQILEQQIAEKKIPGAVISIKKGDKVLMKKAFGFAQVKDAENKWLEKPEKTSVKHLYDIASLSKVVATTTAVMLLVDNQQISVEDEVSKYIPAFDIGDKKTIKIRHLLTHTAGLIEWYPLYYKCKNKNETYQLIDQLPLAYPVGEGRHYSDLGFILLGEIIEKVSGQSFENFVDTNVFKPLSMLNTYYRPLDKNKNLKIAATSHGNPYEFRMVRDPKLGFTRSEIDPNSWNKWRNYTLKGEVNDGNTWYANEGISGAAGVFSTIDDIQKLVDMLKNKGMANGKRFLSEETVKLFLTQDKYKNGLGWMMDPVNAFMKKGPEKTFGHTGFVGTSICVIPEQNLSIIILINRQNVGLLPSQEYYNVNSIREKVFETVMKNQSNR